VVSPAYAGSTTGYGAGKPMACPQLERITSPAAAIASSRTKPARLTTAAQSPRGIAYRFKPDQTGSAYHRGPIPRGIAYRFRPDQVEQNLITAGVKYTF
jgi:hypothetical protein